MLETKKRRVAEESEQAQILSLTQVHDSNDGDGGSRSLKRMFSLSVGEIGISS